MQREIGSDHRENDAIFESTINPRPTKHMDECKIKRFEQPVIAICFFFARPVFFQSADRSPQNPSANTVRTVYPYCFSFKKIVEKLLGTHKK